MDNASLGSGLSLRDYRWFDRAQAIQYYERANYLFEKTAGKRGKAYTLNKIGKMLKEEGEFYKAREHHQDAYNLYQEEDDEPGKADSCNYCGDASLLLDKAAYVAFAR